MAKEVATHIDIDASPEIVWQVLTDFPNYGEWNPFIRSVSGELAVGRVLSFTVATGPTTTVSARARVLVVERNQRLVWGGSLPLGLFRGEHTFRIVLRAAGVRFVDSERFSGPLAWLRITEQRLQAQRQAFTGFDAALRTRAEALMRQNSA